MLDFIICIAKRQKFFLVCVCVCVCVCVFLLPPYKKGDPSSLLTAMSCRHKLISSEDLKIAVFTSPHPEHKKGIGSVGRVDVEFSFLLTLG